MAIRAVIASCGHYLPEKVMTNADFEKIIDTSDEWIQQRSGIQQRHVAADNQATSDLAIEAARDAMKRGGFGPNDIDGVIVATCTPDLTFPSTAVKVQAGLGLKPGMAFDVNAVCSGFVYGLSIANSMIVTGQAKRILLLGAEKMSSVINWEDRTTCVLFGDGAGAVILEADNSGKGTIEDRGILSSHLHANGEHKDILYTTGGISTTKSAGFVVMHGKEVFRHAVQYMSDVVDEVLTKNNITPAQVDWLVPHQANLRIIEGTAKKMGMGMDRVVATIVKHGNTSAASIPLALAVTVNDEKRIKKGDLIVMEALGAGLTWGAVLVRF